VFLDDKREVCTATMFSSSYSLPPRQGMHKY